MHLILPRYGVKYVGALTWFHGNSTNGWNPAIRITMGASVGLPAASLCINRRLYRIASVQSVSITHSDVRVSRMS